MLSSINRTIFIIGMSISMLAIVITYWNQSYFKKSRLRTATEEAIAQQQVLQMEMETSIDRLMSYLQMGATFGQKTESKRSLKAYADALISSHEGIISMGFSVISLDRKLNHLTRANTVDLHNKHFLGRSPQQVLKQLEDSNHKWISSESQKNTDAYLFKNMTPILGIEIVTLAMRMSKTSWAWMSVWADDLNKTFAGHQGNFYFMIDRSGSIISSSSRRAMLLHSPWQHPISSKALQHTSEQDHQSGMLTFGSTRKKRLGLYTWSDRYGIAMVSISDLRRPLTSIRKTVFANVSIGIIILLLACWACCSWLEWLPRRIEVYIKAIKALGQGYPIRSISGHVANELDPLDLAISAASTNLLHLQSEQIAQTKQATLSDLRNIVSRSHDRLTEINTPSCRICVGGVQGGTSETDTWRHTLLDNGNELFFMMRISGDPGEVIIASNILATSYDLITSSPAWTQLKSPDVIMSQLNRSLCQANINKVFARCFVALLDPQDGQLIYANAAHPVPFVMGLKDTRIRFRKRRDESRRSMSPLLGNGDPLGFAIESSYHNQQILLGHYDKIVLYGHGILQRQVEQKSVAKMNLQKSINQSSHQSVNHICDIALSINATTDDQELSDATVIVIDIRKIKRSKIKKVA